jgi:hypothetical protein
MHEDKKKYLNHLRKFRKTSWADPTPLRAIRPSSKLQISQEEGDVLLLSYEKRADLIVTWRFSLYFWVDWWYTS